MKEAETMGQWLGVETPKKVFGLAKVSQRDAIRSGDFRQVTVGRLLSWVEWERGDRPRRRTRDIEDRTNERR